MVYTSGHGRTARYNPAIRIFDQEEFSMLNRDLGREQHNIMFLVGNGFDISALEFLHSDWRTDYESFYHYLRGVGITPGNYLSSSMEELRQLHEAEQRAGRPGFPNWSNFESHLQNNSLPPHQLHRDLLEIRAKFSQFLNQVVNAEVLAKLDYAANQNMWAYRTFSRFLADLDPSAYQKVQLPLTAGYHHLFNFNVINFNFSPLLDNYLYLDQVQFNPRPNSTVDTNFIFRLNPRNYTHADQRRFPNSKSSGSAYIMTEIHHPHGIQSIPRSLLFGIDGNDEIARNGTGLGFEKPFWAQSPRRYLKMINESELFVIFGSSLGETDRWWWRHILRRLYDGSDLIIYKRVRAGDPNFMRNQKETLALNFVTSNFEPDLFGGSSLSPDLSARLKNRIHVITYTDNSTLSAFGFNQDPFDPKDEKPTSICPVF